jgi:hypothetical protein
MAEDVDDLVDELRVGGQLEAPFFFIRSGMSQSRAQFSVLLSVVVLTAPPPTTIAERFFAPDAAAETDAGHATETERILDR